MAVSAHELKPRSAVPLFDAAVRLSSTSSGLWALTLPSGALLVAAVFNLAEAARRSDEVVSAAALLTLAWCVRAISQGAACHYAEALVVGTAPASLRVSVLAACKRAPGLITAAAWSAWLNVSIWVLTFGIGFFFLGAHLAAPAVVMRGQGSVLKLYSTCRKLLGPARLSAPFVRLCGLSQALLAVNLQLSVMAGLSLLHSLFGIEVTFLQRFTSPDNSVWLVTVLAMTFALFEPVRAACATLLLVDGRVRQEGLDLLAQLEQLPRRKKNRGVLLAVALLALPAFAQSGLLRRAELVAEDCEMELDLAPLEREVASRDQSALSRMLTRIERHVFEDDDCERAEGELRESLRLYDEAVRAGPPIDARASVEAILKRPEFQATPLREKTAPEEDDDNAPGWLRRLIDQFLEWLFKRRGVEDSPAPAPATSGGEGVANAVVVGALLLVAAVLLFILVRAIRSAPRAAADDSAGLTQQALEQDPMSALARPAETWAGLADELAARGEFREAIRHLYLALLSRLHRDGVIDYDPVRSNHEYLLAFNGSSDGKRTFRELTWHFDFAWYGRTRVDAPSWATFRSTAKPLLAPADGGAAHA